MMMDGILCKTCGVYIGDAVDYPRNCASCETKEPKKPEKLIKREPDAGEELLK
jgi:hypothetical protein